MRKSKKIISVAIALLTLLPVGVFSAKNHHYASVVDIDHLFDEAIKDHAFPGGCIVAGTKDQVLVQKCFGYHTYENNLPVRADDLFDLASLTKVIGTTAAIMTLYDQHKLQLSDKVVQYIPEFTGPDARNKKLKATITLADLLSHRSGLQEPNGISRLHSATQKTRLEHLYKTPLKYTPHQKTVYSDLNFILLGTVIERITQQSLDDYLTKTIFHPLEMQHTVFRPQLDAVKIVPTYSAKTVGVVHDPIARALGGVCGHAGLFSSITDLQHYAQMLLNNGQYKKYIIFSPNTIALFSKRDDLVLGSTRALGWDTAYRLPVTGTPRQFTAGYYSDADAIGHTGYTGTSIWVSPSQDLYVILLTNRVFGVADSSTQRRDRYWRQEITSAVWKNVGFTQQNALYHERRKLVAMKKSKWSEQ